MRLSNGSKGSLCILMTFGFYCRTPTSVCNSKKTW